MASFDDDSHRGYGGYERHNAGLSHGRPRESSDLPGFLEEEIRRTQEDNTRLQKELGLVAVTRNHHRRFTYDAAAPPAAAAAAAAAAARSDAWPRYQRSAGVSGGSSGAAGFEPCGHRRHSRAATPPPPQYDAAPAFDTTAPPPAQQRRSRTAHTAIDCRRVRAAPSEEERLPSLASRHSVAYVIPGPPLHSTGRTRPRPHSSVDETSDAESRGRQRQPREQSDTDAQAQRAAELRLEGQIQTRERALALAEADLRLREREVELEYKRSIVDKARASLAVPLSASAAPTLPAAAPVSRPTPGTGPGSAQAAHEEHAAAAAAAVTPQRLPSLPVHLQSETESEGGSDDGSSGVLSSRSCASDDEAAVDLVRKKLADGASKHEAEILRRLNDIEATKRAGEFKSKQRAVSVLSAILRASNQRGGNMVVCYLDGKQFHKADYVAHLATHEQPLPQGERAPALEPPSALSSAEVVKAYNLASTAVFHKFHTPSSTRQKASAASSFSQGSVHTVDVADEGSSLPLTSASVVLPIFEPTA